MDELKDKIVIKRRRRKWVRWVLLGLFVLGGGMVAGYFALYEYVVPLIAARRVKEVVKEVWAGPVDVHGATVGHDGRVRIERIDFLDDEGNAVLRTHGVVMRPEQWPSARPTFVDEEIERVEVRVRVIDGKLMIPLSKEKREKRWNVRRVRLGEVDVEVTSGGVGRLGWEDLYIELRRAEKGYELSLRGSVEGGGIEIDGMMDELSGQLDVVLKTERELSAGETMIVKELLGVPGEWIGRGELKTNLRVRGGLADIRGLVLVGDVQLRRWLVSSERRELFRELGANVDVNEGMFDLRKVRGQVCGGVATGACRLAFTDEQVQNVRGRLRVRDIEAAAVTELLFGEAKVSKGKVSGEVQFAAREMGIVNVDGRGVLFINDSDMWALPVVGKILKFVGFEQLGMVGMSDAWVSFGISSGVITIKRGHMSNKLSAIEVEPGGTADISSGQVDMGVIVLVVKGIDELLRAIPVVNWFSAMKDKLSRLRVKGHWSDPMGELIRKEPVRDVKDGTLAFFESVIKSGGQLSESMAGTLGSVLNGNGKGEKKGSNTVDGGKTGD